MQATIAFQGIRQAKCLRGRPMPVPYPEAAINASLSLIISASDSSESVDRRLLMTITPAANMLARKLRSRLDVVEP